MATFFGKEIEVELAGEVPLPSAFRLGSRRFEIAEVVASWHDSGFAPGPERRRRWWQRHHRTYFRVRTSEGELFDLYFDRGTSPKHPERRKWYLLRQL